MNKKETPVIPDDSKESLVIKSIKTASIDDLTRLYKEAGWWEPSFDENPLFLQEIVKESAIFVGAFQDLKLIGMGRALSDLVSDAFIQDVTVLKAFRGRGIGKKIIRDLLEKLKEHDVDWIGLIAEPGTSSFYKNLGFDVLKDHIPFKYNPHAS